MQQLTSCWGLRERVEVTELSTFIKYMLSMAAVAAKAQQEPHCCWSRIGVTFPAVTQLTLEADGSVFGRIDVFEEAEAEYVLEPEAFMRYEDENRLKFMCANLLADSQ